MGWRLFTLVLAAFVAAACGEDGEAGDSGSGKKADNTGAGSVCRKYGRHYCAVLLGKFDLCRGDLAALGLSQRDDATLEVCAQELEKQGIISACETELQSFVAQPGSPTQLEAQLNLTRCLPCGTFAAMAATDSTGNPNLSDADYLTLLECGFDLMPVTATEESQPE